MDNIILEGDFGCDPCYFAEWLNHKLEDHTDYLRYFWSTHLLQDMVNLKVYKNANFCDHNLAWWAAWTKFTDNILANMFALLDLPFNSGKDSIL